MEEGEGGNSPPLGRWGGGGIPSPGVEIPPLRDTEVGGKSPPGGISLLLEKKFTEKT